ncbi:MAG: hypothetical protein RRB13_08110 [bacterium]|nr:hypothetical protein [bacterium]
MELKDRLLAWFAEDSDRITEPEDLAEAFPEDDPAALAAIREEEMVRLVAENLRERPGLKFHDYKNLYPFPSSAELKLAQAVVDPEAAGELKKRH